MADDPTVQAEGTQIRVIGGQHQDTQLLRREHSLPREMVVLEGYGKRGKIGH